MTAQESMKQFVTAELRPIFKKHGYKTKGLTFHRQVSENFGVIQLQKNRYSTAQEISFTINVSIFSARVHRGLSKVMWRPTIKEVPTEPACHIRERIGELLGVDDTWWSVPSGGPPPELAATIRDALESHAFPFIDARITDEGMRDHWRRTRPGGPDGLGLAVLLRDLGPNSELAPWVDALKARMSPASTIFNSAVERFAAALE